MPTKIQREENQHFLDTGILSLPHKLMFLQKESYFKICLRIVELSVQLTNRKKKHKNKESRGRKQNLSINKVENAIWMII
jgi:hypothetical protein